MNKKMLRNIIISAVALVVLAGVILGIIFIPSCGDEKGPGEIDYGVAMRTGITQDGLHYAEILTNDKGEIENNSYGTLIDKIPSEISKISLETQKGNYSFLLTTPTNPDGSTEATVYTLEGFEDLTTQGTNQALLASAVCNIDFSKVADLKGEKSSEFGFDNPRAKATVTYTDGTYSIVTLGDTAAGGESCYIKFGEDDTIYIVPFENMEPMLFDITDMMSTSINSNATSVADDCFDKIRLGGTHLEDEVVIEKNTDKALSCYYVMSSHGNMPVSNTVGANIVGTIKSLSAEEVLCVNPDSKQLKEYGLSNPYATVKTKYTYSENEYDENGTQVGSEKKTLAVSLIASKPTQDGFVNLMEENGKLVYKISADRVAWVEAGMSELRNEYIFAPAYSALSKVTMTAEGKTYSFVMGTEQVKVSDGDGSATETTQVTVTLDGKKLSEPNFYTLAQDLSMLTVKGEDNTSKTKEDLLKVTYEYNTGRSADTVVIKGVSSQKAIALVNGERAGYVYMEQIEKLIENVHKVAKGVEITTVLG